MTYIQHTHWLLIFMFLCMMPDALKCQRFENLNEAFPLSSSEVIFQDAKGFLWVGTQNGLFSYDGYSFEEYLSDKDDPYSLSGNNINALSQDTKGRIWVGVSNGGLNILDIERDTFQRICLPVENDTGCTQEVNVNAFAPHENRQMWVGTEYGLYLLDYEHQLRSIWHARGDTNHIHGLSNSIINHLLKDQKGRLWIGTRQGIHLYLPEVDSFISPLSNTGFPNYPILDINKDRNGVIWISTRFSEERLYFFDEQDFTFKADSTFIGTDLGEFKFTFDLENNLWVSARGRGAYFSAENSKEYTFFHQSNAWKHGYSNVLGLATLCDKYGNIWMTGESLLKWPNTGKEINHWESNAGKILAIQKSGSYFWYCNNKPLRFNLHTDQFEDFFPAHLPTNIKSNSSSYNYQRIYEFLEWDESRLIFCMFRNIIIWDHILDTYREFPFNYGGPFKDIELTQDNSHLWICSNHGSPILLNLNTGKEERPSYVAEIQRPTRVVRDHHDNYWFGTYHNGIFKLDEQLSITSFNEKQENEKQLLPSLSVADMALSSGGILWIATNRGLFKINTKTSAVEQMKLRYPYLEMSMNSIIVDEYDHVWMGTLKGLIRFKPKKGQVDLFSPEDGLENQLYSIRTTFEDEDGVLYFGGNKGIDIVNPKNLHKNIIPPDLYIQSLLVNNKRKRITESKDSSILHLRYDENFISVDLLSLHLTSPEANRILYNIPEIDTVWRQLGVDQKVELANLSPGRYTLKGRTSNGDEAWSKPKQLAVLQIHPPWWESSWFMVAAILLMGLLVVGAYRYRINIIKERERIKTEFNKQIAEVESKALRAQMNPHFLFNSINAVNALISQGKNESASIYLKKFGKLIRLVLSNSEKPMVRLETEIEALELFLEIEQLRFQNFEYDIEIDPLVDTDFIEVPPLILQPYVENAIWHGLMHKTEGSRKVSIKVLKEKEDLICIVEDNGIGRKQAAQVQTKGAARKKGLGMRLTSDRLKILEKLNGAEVTTQVIDLSSKKGQAKGTRILIKIASVQ